jgi:hypothetical protein
VAVWFHLSEHCELAPLDGKRFRISVGGGSVILEIDTQLAIQTIEGGVEPIGGWISRGYHRKAPATTVVGRADIRGGASLRCRLLIGPPHRPSI